MLAGVLVIQRLLGGPASTLLLGTACTIRCCWLEECGPAEGFMLLRGRLGYIHRYCMAVVLNVEDHLKD